MNVFVLTDRYDNLAQHAGDYFCKVVGVFTTREAAEKEAELIRQENAPYFSIGDQWTEITEHSING